MPNATTTAALESTSSSTYRQQASAHEVMRPPLIRRSSLVFAGRPSTAAEAGQAGFALCRHPRLVPPLARPMHNIGNGKMHMCRPSSLDAPFAAIYSGTAAAAASFSSFSSASTSPSPASSSSSPPPQKPTIFQHIPPEELSKLNQTSVGLYRLLLKECARLRHFDGCLEASNHAGDDVMLLLQDEVNTEEFGKIQPYFGSDACADGSTSGKAAAKQTPEEEQEASAVPAFVGDDDDDIAAWSVINLFLRNMQTNQTQSDLLSKIDETLLSLGADSNSPRLHRPQLLSVTPSQLVHAVRTAFLRVVVVQADEDVKKDDDNDDDNASGSYNNPELQSMALRSMTKADVVALHRRAIDAVPFLHAQRNLMECTSLGIDSEQRVSVFATSKWKSKGLLSRGAGLDRQEEHVFVYRIRIVYHRGSSKNEKGKPIQLLGRRWMITDGVERKYEEHTGMDEDDDDDYEEPDVQVVDAPRTGVVGYHPILHPGDVFEYTSGCNLINSVGKMEGSYVFCEIEEEDVVDEAQKLQRIGDELLSSKYEAEEEMDGEVSNKESKRKNEQRFFEVPVEPFLLDASK